MDINVNDTYLEQFSHETAFEYLECLDDYLEEYSDHGLLEHEVIKMFLDGMLPEEHYTLDVNAGGSILGCCVREVWDI